MKRRIPRRVFMPVAGIALSSGIARMNKQQPPLESMGGDISVVSICKAATYTQDLVGPMLDGLRACGLDVRGRAVLLKPNLVEFDRSTAINTDAAVVAAAYEALRKAGARSVVVGEGPGHRRDTLDLARQAGYTLPVTDLNRDDVSEVRGFAVDGSVFLPNTALSADLVVSLAKMKTHHWAGVTLSMKNLFGVVPGAIYGWPKNRLHYIGITRSILELNRLFRNTFAIVDGISGMEGNGPIQGKPKAAGVLVMGSDMRAVDSTCCRVMGIDPAKIEYLRGAGSLGHLDEAWIEQRGEQIGSVATDFELIPQYSKIRLARGATDTPVGNGELPLTAQGV